MKSANKQILDASVLKRVIGGTSGGGLDPTVKKEKQEKAPLPPKDPEANDLVRG